MWTTVIHWSSSICHVVAKFLKEYKLQCMSSTYRGIHSSVGVKFMKE